MFAVFLVVCSLSGAHAQTALTATKFVSVNSGATTTNYNAGFANSADTFSPYDAANYLLMEFNVSSIPTTACLQSAVLTLTYSCNSLATGFAGYCSGTGLLNNLKNVTQLRKPH
jgi:hypothetical protein